LLIAMNNLLALNAAYLATLLLYIGHHFYVIYLKISCFVTVYAAILTVKSTSYIQFAIAQFLDFLFPSVFPNNNAFSC